jgi:hypothetical protein
MAGSQRQRDFNLPGSSLARVHGMRDGRFKGLLNPLNVAHSPTLARRYPRESVC